MVSVANVVSLTAAAAALLCAVLASPLPSDEARDATASAPSSNNFLNCANGVGQGNGFNNCSMPAAPSGMPSGMPEMPSGMPDGSWPENFPQPPQGMPSSENRPSISQGVECATAVGQGNGFNNCSNIIQPAGRG